MITIVTVTLSVGKNSLRFGTSSSDHQIMRPVSHATRSESLERWVRIVGSVAAVTASIADKRSHYDCGAASDVGVHQETWDRTRVREAERRTDAVTQAV